MFDPGQPIDNYSAVTQILVAVFDFMTDTDGPQMLVSLDDFEVMTSCMRAVHHDVTFNACGLKATTATNQTTFTVDYLLDRAPATVAAGATQAELLHVDLCLHDATVTSPAAVDHAAAIVVDQTAMLHALDSDCTVLANPCIEAAVDANLDGVRADRVNTQETEQTVSL